MQPSPSQVPEAETAPETAPEEGKAVLEFAAVAEEASEAGAIPMPALAIRQDAEMGHDEGV